METEAQLSDAQGTPLRGGKAGTEAVSVQP